MRLNGVFPRGKPKENLFRGKKTLNELFQSHYRLALFLFILFSSFLNTPNYFLGY